MPRIPYPEKSEIDPKLAQYLDSLGPLNITRMLGHGSAAGFAHAKSGVALLHKGQLNPQLRELVILRVGHLAKSNYEIYQHTSVARLVGVTEDKILGTAEGSASLAFNATERVVLSIVDELHLETRISNELFEQVRELLTTGQLVELIILIGYYMTTARILETFEIEPEGDVSLGSYWSQLGL